MLKIENEYLKNILTLALGTGAAQLIPIIILPMLTRLYTPSEFGIFGGFVGVTALMAIIATAKYDIAIIQPIDESDADQVFKLSIFTAISFVCCLYILLFIFESKILALTGYYEMVFLIPVTALIISLNSSFSYLLNRKKFYKQMSLNKILQSVLVGIISLVLGYVNFGYLGLIAGYIIGSFFVTLILFFKYWKCVAKANTIRMFYMAKKYRSYPLYSLPSGISNVSANQLPVIWLTKIFNADISGFYFLVHKILSAPIALFSSSVGLVFRQYAQSEKISTGTYSKIYITTLKKLSLMGLPIFTIVGLFGQEIFSFIFGSEWKVAGLYAQILSPMFFLKFTIFPLLSSFNVSDKLKIDFIGQVIHMLSIVMALLIGYFYNSALYSIVFISLFGSIFYLIFLFISYRLSKDLARE
jgi:O-antigen/teichoic acid export membrane protein